MIPSPASATQSTLVLTLLSRPASRNALLAVLAAFARLAQMAVDAGIGPAASADTALGDRAREVQGPEADDQPVQQRHPSAQQPLAAQAASQLPDAAAVSPSGSAPVGTDTAAEASEAADAERCEFAILCMQGVRGVAYTSVRAVVAQGTTVPAPPEAIDFSRRMLRTQALQCCSRWLAAAAAQLRGCLERRPSGGQPQRLDRQDSREASGLTVYIPALGAALTMSLLVLEEAQQLMDAMMIPIHMCFKPTPSGPALEADYQRACSAYVFELAAALRDSCLLEHAAQALLLSAHLAGAAERDGAEVPINVGPFAMKEPGIHSSFTSKYLATLSSWIALLDGLSGTRRVCALRQEHDSELILDGVLAGPCVSHLVAVAAVATLVAADGGTAYGTPPELLRALPALGQRTDGKWADLRLTRGSACPGAFYLTCLDVLSVQRSGRGLPPLACRAALLLRIGRRAEASLAASAAAAASGEQGGPLRATDHQAELGPNMAKSTSPESDAAACSPRSVSGGDQPQQQEPQPPSLRCCMHGTVTVAVLALAITRLGEVLAAAPRGAGWIRAALVERWRLAVTAAQHTALLADPAEPQALGRCLRLQRLNATLDYGSLPPQPPLPLAAALECGLPRCLERLLRRAAEDPHGPCAAVFSHALDNDLTLTLSAHLGGLLAYGDPRDVAALLASLAKALRHLVPQLLGAQAAPEAAGGHHGPAPGRPDVPAAAVDRTGAAACSPDSNTAASALRAVHNLGVGVMLCSPDWMATARKVSGTDACAVAPGPARQLAQLESYAVCEVLPVLSNMVQRGALLLEAGTGLTLTADGAARLCTTLRPLLLWLTLLPPPPQQQPPPRGSAAAPPSHAVSEELRALLIEEVGAVPLMGAALRIMSRPDMVRHCKTWGGLWARLGAALLAVAAACSQELRTAAVTAVFSAARDRVEPAAGVISGGGLTATEWQKLSCWSPQRVRSVAGEARRRGYAWQADGAEAVAAWLEGGMLGAFQPPAIGPDAAHAALCEAVHAAFALPTEVRGLLRTCGNPSCTNLAGDTEAKLPLKACAGCGVVGYCCRECQAAHWRAGHKSVCIGRRGG